MITNTSSGEDICRHLLKIYGLSENYDSHITNFKTHISQLYSYNNIYSFDYKNEHYYVVDDPSLDDQIQYIENKVRDIDAHVSGGPVKNPVPQSDGAIYAAGWEDTEYYLWKCP